VHLVLPGNYTYGEYGDYAEELYEYEEEAAAY